MQVLWILSLASLFLFGSVSYSKTIENLCLSPIKLSKRSLQDSCYGEFRISAKRQFCLSRSLWPLYLEGRDFCGQAEGQWKVKPFTQHYRFEVKAFYFAPTTFFRKMSTSIRAKIETLREVFSQRLAPWDSTGMLRVLILNESHFEKELDIFWILGFVHLLNITGLHLYILWQGILLLGEYLTPFFSIPVLVQVRVWRGMAAIICGFMWLLTGFRAGMLRPLIIVALRKIALIFGFRWRIFYPLIFALLLDLGVACFLALSDNDAAWAPGRWHYALAVGGALTAIELSQKNKKENELQKHLLLCFGSWIPIAFIDLFLNKPIALATPLISLVTFPMMALGVLPMAVLASALDASWIVKTIGIFLKFILLKILKLSAVFHFLWISEGSKILWALAIICLCFLFFSPVVRKITLGFLVCWGLFRSTPSEPQSFEKPRALRITQIDVGQGDAALVRWKSSTAMVDVGPLRAKTLANWIDFFSKEKVTKLSWIFLTHLDEDHRGGLEKIKTLIPIQQIADEKRFKPDESVNIYYCKGRGPNAQMGTLKIDLEPQGTYWSFGDADQVCEWKAYSYLSSFEALQSPVLLKISHHGSKTSSNFRVLKKIQPTEAWISVGRKNHYGHPTIEVLNRLSALQIPTRRTDQEGTLIWDVATKPYKP